MTMRAPPLARMAAVAAPRPDAEPVTIAHNPSFDIGISSDDFSKRDAIYHIVRRSARKSATLLHAGFAGALAEIGACIGRGFSSSCRARKTAPMPGENTRQDVRTKRGVPWRRVRILSTILPCRLLL